MSKTCSTYNEMIMFVCLYFSLFIWWTILFMDDMIVYINNPKKSMRKLLQCIHLVPHVCHDVLWKDFCSSKSISFLYTNDKWTEKEVRKTTSFTIATNKIKCFAVTLTANSKVLLLYRIVLAILGFLFFHMHNPEINPNTPMDDVVKTIQWEKESICKK